MRFTDLMMAFPALLLAIVLAALLKPSLWIVALVIAMVNWVQVARIVYTETRGLTERDFILAERSLGAGHDRIVLVHVLPHLMPTAIVWGTLGIATTVLLEATLSFLGIGVQPPEPSWGNIIFESQSYFTAAPWLVFFPVSPSSSPPSPSISSATRCATSSTPRSGGEADGRAPRRRLAGAILILIGVAAITFLLLYAIPADPAVMLAGRSATRETVANIRHELGLDQPLLLQFATYLGNLLQGDLGRSYTQKTEVTALIAARLPGDAHPDGLRHPGGGCDRPRPRHPRRRQPRRGRRPHGDDGLLRRGLRPQFVVALFLLYVFAATLGWFPMSGFGTPAHVVLPP